MYSQHEYPHVRQSTLLLLCCCLIVIYDLITATWAVWWRHWAAHVYGTSPDVVPSPFSVCTLEILCPQFQIGLRFCDFYCTNCTFKPLQVLFSFLCLKKTLNTRTFILKEFWSLFSLDYFTEVWNHNPASKNSPNKFPVSVRLVLVVVFWFKWGIWESWIERQIEDQACIVCVARDIFPVEKKSTQAVKTTPHIKLRKGATLVPSTVKLLHREKERTNQWGSGGLQAWPETGSWWEMITVLERARLVWTSLAAKFTECTWRLEANFLTLWESRPSSLKGFRVWVL